MKSQLSLLLFALAATSALGQLNNDQPKLDLRKLSSEKLTACLEETKACGLGDIYAITHELIRRLPELSTNQLVSCFADWRICGTGEGEASGWPISDELARRGDPHLLLVRYWTEPDQEIRDGIVDVAYHSKSPEVAAFMRKVLSESKGQDDEAYWPANYLAKQCAPDGLKWISDRPQRMQGCIQFQTSIPLFGKCHYRPAIPYLINSSLDDACLNIVDAAATDLAKMYPHSPKGFDSIREMRQYFCGRAKQEGFKIACEPNGP
jgi:hypothetical protein